MSEYCSATETAQKWGLSGRRVGLLCAQERIPGAVKIGKTWMIPADAEKPGDPRREKKQPPENSLSSELAELIEALANAESLPWDDPDGVAATIGDESFRLFVEGWLAYLRGDFERTKLNFLGIRSEAVKLWSCSLAIATAVCTGDYPLYEEIEAYCKNLISADMGANVTTIAQWALSTAAVGAYVPAMIPDWLKDGDFSALPPPLKQEVLHKRAGFFLHEKKAQSALDVAQTGLTFYERAHGMSYMGIYLRVMCAAACCFLGRFNDAKNYLLDVMRDCLPHGFITPFTEMMPHFGGLLEQCLEQEFPNYYNAVTGQSKRTITNWIDFHNRYTQDNITLILSPREYQIALVVARGVTFKRTAEQFSISLGTLQNNMSIIYQKLSINSKRELSRFIFY